MDYEIAILLRGHGLLDFTADDPDTSPLEMVEVCYVDSVVGDKFWVQVGYGEQVIDVLGDWLDGHSEFQDSYEVFLYAFDGDAPIAECVDVRSAKALQS